MNQRRKLSNLIIDRKALTRLSVPFLTLAALSIAIVLTIQWRILDTLRSIELHGLENLAAINSLLRAQEAVTLIGTIGILVFCVSCLVLWIIFSHRIFGPMVPIRRHIEKLIEGDYTTRVHPRSTDEFKDLMNDLNRLAEKLGGKN